MFIRAQHLLGFIFTTTAKIYQLFFFLPKLTIFWVCTIMQYQFYNYITRERTVLQPKIFCRAVVILGSGNHILHKLTLGHKGRNKIRKTFFISLFSAFTFCPTRYIIQEAYLLDSLVQSLVILENNCSATWNHKYNMACKRPIVQMHDVHKWHRKKWRPPASFLEMCFILRISPQGECL